MKITIGLFALLLCGTCSPVNAEEGTIDVNELYEQFRTGEAYEQKEWPIVQKAEMRINKGETCDERYFTCDERESFWSGTNLMMGAGLFGTAVADMETTYRVTTLPPVESGGYIYAGSEGNPLASPFVNRGRAVGYAYKMGLNTGAWILSHNMRRSDKRGVRIMGWVTPFVVMGLQGYLAKHNSDNYQFLTSLP